MAKERRHSCKVEEGREGKDGAPSVGPVYRNSFSKNGFPAVRDGVHTCWDVFAESVRKYPNNSMLGTRENVNGKAGNYVWQTYQQVYDKVIKLGSAMRTVGLEPTKRCGIYGINCPEWFMAMEACNGHSIYCVPLYDTLGEEAVEFILNHAEVSIVFAHSLKIDLLIKSLPKCTEHVKTFVSFGTLTGDQKASMEGLGISSYSWEEFLELGQENPVDLSPPKISDICTIMYTSGTTGEPKGVLIKNESIVEIIAATDFFLVSLNEKLETRDVLLSYLPLAHIFDRVVEEFFVYTGAQIGFWQGDVKLLTDDISALRPTIFIGVPRVFERIQTGLYTKMKEAGGLKKALFDFGFKSKLYYIKKGYKQDKASPFFDMLIFNKVKAALGGRVRLILSGAAPLADHTEEFLRTTLCCPVVQGYGLTETCAATFIAIPDVFSMSGTVGPPATNVEARLESVPEMNYDALADTPRGEVCIRSKALFAGYYKRDDLTKEVLTDGWFHTGDIGEWQPDGALKIIDRKKNIFKLSQGEYVAVENLENLYSMCPSVESIWVYGNSFESVLVAVVVPARSVLEQWAKENDVDGDFRKICQNPKANEFVLKELSALTKSSKLKGFEAIRAVHLEPEPFNLERDLLTPTYKLKRTQLLRYYQTVINSLYEKTRK